MSVMGIAAGVGAAVGIASAVSSGKQSQKAIQAQINQGALESRAAEELNKAALKANDRNAKTKLIADSVANIKNAQYMTAMQIQRDKELADQKNKVILTIGGGVIVVASAIVLTRK